MGCIDIPFPAPVFDPPTRKLFPFVLKLCCGFISVNCGDADGSEIALIV